MQSSPAHARWLMPLILLLASMLAPSSVSALERVTPPPRQAIELSRSTSPGLQRSYLQTRVRGQNFAGRQRAGVDRGETPALHWVCGLALSENASGYTVECNLYSYALNNPVQFTDPTGEAVNPYVAYMETYNHARRQGLSHEDAHQIAQETREAHAGMHDVVGQFIWDAFGDTAADVVEFVRSIWNRDVMGTGLSGGAILLPGVSARGLKKIVGHGDELAGAALGLASRVRWKGFSKGKLAEHFEKHVLLGREFGDISKSQYLKMAKDFAAEAGDFLEQSVGNFIVKFDPATNRTLIGHSGSREIRTFYRADGRSKDPFQAAIDLARELSGK